MALRGFHIFAAALPLFMLLATALPPTGVEAADTERCALKARMNLTAIGLKPDDLKSIRLIESFGTSNNADSRDAGIDAWIQLKTCSGWLIVNMSSTCFIRQTYTRGACHIEGLANY